jgi:Cu/Ag efflux protein CusF
MRRALSLPFLVLFMGAAIGDATPPDRFGPNEGLVMAVDRKAQEITVRHGYLPELSMDAMTMVFNVAEPALLDKVRKGERVRIRTGLVNGRFAILAIEPIRRGRNTKGGREATSAE